MAYQYKLAWYEVDDKTVPKETGEIKADRDYFQSTQDEYGPRMIDSVNKGDKFYCYRDCKDYYTRGEYYLSDRDMCITDNEGDSLHGWSEKWKDYFTKIETAPLTGDTIVDKFDSSVKIMETFSNLSNLLVYKNSLYGDSGLHPIKVFSKESAETGLLQRLDDKIARVQNSPELRKNDVADIIGYLVLICVSKGWTNFDEFKD